MHCDLRNYLGLEKNAVISYLKALASSDSFQLFCSTLVFVRFDVAISN